MQLRLLYLLLILYAHEFRVNFALFGFEAAQRALVYGQNLLGRLQMLPKHRYLLICQVYVILLSSRELLKI